MRPHAKLTLTATYPGTDRYNAKQSPKTNHHVQYFKPSSISTSNTSPSATN